MTYFLLSNIKEDILKNVGKQTVSVPIDFHYMDEEKKKYSSKLETETLVTNILQNIFFCVQ